MNKIIVIVGPTGIGKTKLSISLAHSFNGEIINGDSMQIYKRLNIGTAKIKEAEKKEIVHHLFDICEVDQPYSVFDYQRDGRKVIANIFKRKKVPVIVGGTGLYIKALLYDYRFTEKKDKAHYEKYTNQKLYDMVLQLNPNTNIHPHNRRRLLNALVTNPQKLYGETLLYDVIFIGLMMAKDELYKNIDDRVTKMKQEGLVEEVKALYDQGIKSKAVLTAIGYKELYQYFDNIISLEEAFTLIKRNSRRYAKRQYTWFNNKMKINWFQVNTTDFNITIKEVSAYLKKHLS